MSTPDDIEMAEASLEEVPTTISPIAETPGSRSGTPHTDASHLWEKANEALEELLATKSSINACRQKVVWELGMELRQNDSKTMESIKEARAIYTHASLDAEALCPETIKEAKATCTPIWEAKALCSQPSGMAETQEASQADSLQQRHVKTIQHLEEQAIQEEGKSQIDFLSVCQSALQASPVELKRYTGSFLPLIDGRGTHTPPIHLITRSFPY